MIQFNRATCGNQELASQREWLETNGIGGFASSTITGLNTRRYHGLLVAATKPPVGRVVLLSKLEEAIILNGRRFELSANQYPGAVHPRGHQYLKEFRLDPFPVFEYEVEGFTLRKSVFMIQGENSTVILYEFRSGVADAHNREVAADDCFVEIRPLIAFRDYHNTTHENSALDPRIQTTDRITTITPYSGLPALHLAHDAEEIDAAGYWYRSLEYEAERERGLDFVEDLFNPFVLKFDLRGRKGAAIIASTERRDVNRSADYRRAEIERRRVIVRASPAGDELVKQLVAAADQYIVARGDQKSVIAGYHWFSDWGRDTMIALPGLTLVAGRADVAKSILLEFARHLDCGMLPNRFPDAGEPPEYNAVDATLWFFEAVRALYDYTGDHEFVRTKLYDALADAIAWHVRGTRYGIRMDQDGLLLSGEEGVQLTWMDAKVGDYVVTPRSGKAVEIQALWYNALRLMEDLAGKFGHKKDENSYHGMAMLARQSFNKQFWNENAGCLYDVVDGDSPDGSIRPNQIFAVSLTYTMLGRKKARGVVEAVERHLLTPCGLRSLAPTDPKYRGRYEGDPRSRDTAYHQGTVWAWLMGPFMTAYIKVNNQNGAQVNRARARATQWLATFGEHMRIAGLGQVSEIFDGDSPHLPRGCIAQAWSVAELVRAGVEDVLNIRPARKRNVAVSAKRMKAGVATSGELSNPNRYMAEAADAS